MKLFAMEGERYRALMGVGWLGQTLPQRFFSPVDLQSGEGAGKE